MVKEEEGSGTEGHWHQESSGGEDPTGGGRTVNRKSSSPVITV